MAYHQHKDEAPLLTGVQVAAAFIGAAFMLLGLIFDPLLDTNYLFLIGCLLELFFVLFFICIIIFVFTNREKLSLFIYTFIFCIVVYFLLVPKTIVAPKAAPVENTLISDNSFSHATDDIAMYWGSKNSDIIHKASCRYAKNILKENRVYYKSVEDAEKDGRIPCSVCLGE